MTTDQQADRPLVDPRDAFTELARLPFDNTSMEAMLQRVAELAKHVIPGVAEASVTLIANDKATTAAYTGQLALDLDETQYGRGYGPASKRPSARRSWGSPTPARRRAGPITPGSRSNAAR